MKKKTLLQKFLTYGLVEKALFKIFKKLGVNNRNNATFLKLKSINRIKRFLKRRLLGKKLKIRIKNRIKFQFDIRSYKGVRHKSKYPVRGQRTHTNARTSKKLSKL